jgi:outer membrane protein TolC
MVCVGTHVFSVTTEVLMSVGLSRIVSLVCAVVCATALVGCAALSPAVTEAEVAGFTSRLVDEFAAMPEPLVGALTLDDAVSRAVRFNHTIRAKELEAALADAKVRAQGGAMLPSVVAESDYYGRDRAALSRSNQSSGYSTSSDTHSVSRDLAISWNILDFGLSYIRAKQGLDKAHQSQEEARRVTARIVEETRSIFWRAVALKKLTPAMAALDREVDEALRLSRQAEHGLQIDPMAQVSFQREMLNLQRDLNGLDAGLVGATDQLKASIGLPLADHLQLSSDRKSSDLPKVNDTAVDDIRIALNQRPEIRQHLYDLRISADEIDATLLQLLPGVTFSRTFASDSNQFLLHNNWISWGTRIAGNLINLVRLPSDLDAIDAQMMAHRQNALATAATIVVQVHMARARVAVQKRSYRDAERYAEAQRHILQQVRASVKLGKVGQQALAREKLASLQAEVRSILAFADLHAAYAAYATARGDDPQPISRARGIMAAKIDANRFLAAGTCDLATQPRNACTENLIVPVPSL